MTEMVCKVQSLQSLDLDLPRLSGKLYLYFKITEFSENYILIYNERLLLEKPFLERLLLGLRSKVFFL